MDDCGWAVVDSSDNEKWVCREYKFDEKIVSIWHWKILNVSRQGWNWIMKNGVVLWNGGVWLKVGN